MSNLNYGYEKTSIENSVRLLNNLYGENIQISPQQMEIMVVMLDRSYRRNSGSLDYLADQIVKKFALK